MKILKTLDVKIEKSTQYSHCAWKPIVYLGFYFLGLVSCVVKMQMRTVGEDLGCFSYHEINF